MDNQNNIKQNISLFLRFQKEMGDVYSKKISQAASQCSLSKVEADVLLFLANNPQYDTARDVVEYRGFSKAFVSGAVELLLEKRLISIAVSKTDRRFQHLSVTDAADPHLEVLKNTQQEFIKELTRGVQPADIASFQKVVEQFINNISNMK